MDEFDGSHISSSEDEKKERSNSKKKVMQPLKNFNKYYQTKAIVNSLILNKGKPKDG
jgi:hypothetical protein